MRTSGIAGVLTLDAERWVANAGREAFDPRLWYMAKVPFSTDVFRAAARDVKAGLRAVGGTARKLLIVDLDDTLWGGIVGESGPEGLRLGGHDPVGEAFVDFQHALKALANRGVVLGIVSKNEEAVALRALREHPEMVLRPDDFAGWRINWEDKALNVLELAAELELGLDATVFIDDNPSERGRVQEALPAVAVPDWPQDPLRFPSALRSLDLFDLASISAEDRQRSASYTAERERREQRARVGSIDEWLASLALEVTAAPLDDHSLPRAVQLLNKTNQMNLRTRRMTDGEFAAWAEGPDRSIWTFRVRDRYNDAGLTGLLSLGLRGSDAWIEDFILSCRVFGRDVEKAMLHLAADIAAGMGAHFLAAEYIPTEKNQPCHVFLHERSGLDVSEGPSATYRWSLSRPYPLPTFFALTRIDVAAAPLPAGEGIEG
jgi:FkbH-like protein